MMWVLFLVIVVALPFAVLWQSIRAIRSQPRGKRLGASTPLVMLIIALAVQVRSFKTDPMGHGGVFFAGVGLTLLASIMAFAQSESKEYRQRNKTTPPEA